MRLVAASIRKLCPLNLDMSRAAVVSVWRTDATSASRENGDSDLRRNSGPGVEGLIAR